MVDVLTEHPARPREQTGVFDSFAGRAGACFAVFDSPSGSGRAAARRAFGRVKHEQILTTGAPYVVTPCHNCHSQIHDLSEHYGGGYRAVHLWTLLALSLGVLGVNERTYLGPDLADAVL